MWIQDLKAHWNNLPTRLAIIAFITLVAVTVGFAALEHNRDSLSEPARVRAEARCESEMDPVACEQLFEAHHERCARLAHKSVKQGKNWFHEGNYYDCVTLTPEGYRKMRRAKRLEREAAEREMMGGF